MKGKLQKWRADKSGDVDWTTFNFIENLLVFRTLEELTVPAESGVMFRISRPQGESGICLLIHIDHGKFPIIESGVPRPDYLTVYLHGDGCICTIIEMKGRSESNVVHGLEQIETLAKRLRDEFQQCLPRSFHLHIQGILLCPPNAQVPGQKIIEMARQGMTILPAQCASRAELYRYISQRIELKTRFQNAPCRDPAEGCFLEQTLARNALRKRIVNGQPISQARQSMTEGLHICYLLSDNGDHMALVAREKQCAFVVSEKDEENQNKLRADIAANGLDKKFIVEAVPTAEE